MPRKYHREEEVDAILRPHLEDIRAGATDAEIAKKTAIGVRAVQRWRLRNTLKKPRGAASKKIAAVRAISLLGESLEDVKHRVAESPVGGAWEPPVFLTREHIKYPLFLRLLDAGHRLAGMSERELVEALGVAAVNITQGLQLLRATVHSTKCPRCGHPTSDTFCSAICARLPGRST